MLLENVNNKIIDGTWDLLRESSQACLSTKPISLQEISVFLCEKVIYQAFGFFA